MFRLLLSDHAILRSRVLSQARRSFFYAPGGEVGISGNTARTSILSIIGLTIAGFIGLKFFLFDHLSTKRQFLQDTTDLWTDDGTVMQGEEAVANLRIQHERIMPFMDEIQAKILAATSGESGNEEESGDSNESKEEESSVGATTLEESVEESNGNGDESTEE